MTITLSARRLRQAMDIIGKCPRASKSDAVPILATTLMEVGPGALTLTATTLDTHVSVTLRGADIDISDTTATSGAFATTSLAAIATLYGAETVTMSLDHAVTGPTLTVDGERRVTLGGSDAIDFPAALWPGVVGATHLPPVPFRAALAAVKTAISKEETRYYLNGIFIEAAPDDGALYLVATDGRRLCRRALDLPDGLPANLGVILPHTALPALMHVLTKVQAETLRFEVSGRGRATDSAPWLRLHIDTPDLSVTIQAKAIDGTYPEYRKAIGGIGANNDLVISVDRTTLRAASGRALKVSGRNSRTTSPLTLRLNGADIRVTSLNSDVGLSMTEAVPVIDSTAGDRSLTIGINAQFLHAALAGVAADTMQMTACDARSPIMLRDPAEPRGYDVIMPMYL